MSKHVPVEVRQAISPDGRVGVLLQIPNGYLLVSPTNAERVALELSRAAAEVRSLFGDWEG